MKLTRALVAIGLAILASAAFLIGNKVGEMMR
jgi:hypothetical protein